MIRDGFVSNSSSTTFIVIMDVPCPATAPEFRRLLFMPNILFESSPTDYDMFTRKELYQQIITDASAQSVNDFLRIRQILRWRMDQLPSVVTEGELSWYLRGDYRTAFEKEVKLINAKYSMFAMEELNNIMHNGSSYTYVFEYGDTGDDFDAAMEHSDIWDYMPGIVIPLSNH